MKFLKVMFIMLLVVSSSNHYLHSEESGQKIGIEYVIAKYFQGEYQESILLLNNNFSVQNDPKIAYLYGLCHLKLHMNKIAINYLEIALEQNEDNYEILNNIGAAYFQEKDYLNAMKYFHLSFISNSDYVIAKDNYNTAYELWTSGQDGIGVYTVIPFTEKPTIYNSLGWYYYYMNDHQNAIYYFKKAIEEDEKYHFAYISLAYLYDEQNNFESALYYLEQAERIDANSPDLQNNLGIIYYHIKDYGKSEEAFKRAIALNHNFPEPYNNLGFLYLEKDELSQSESYLNKSIEINLVNQRLKAETLAGLAFVNFKNNNISKSIQYKKMSISLDYKMNDVAYLIDILQWNKELITIWNSISY